MAKNVLVIDDDFDDLETMKEILEIDGFEVKATTKGSDALNLLEANNFDLILIDIRMPALTGYDLLKMVKEKLNNNPKIMYVSIVPEQEVILEDADGFIQKPFSPETFISKIKGIMEE